MGNSGKIADVPRTAIVSPGGMLFHVLNRGVGRMQIFRAEKCCDAFQQVVEETLCVAPIRNMCLFPTAQSIAHSSLARSGRGPVQIHAALTNMQTQHWQRAKLCVGYGYADELSKDLILPIICACPI
jgi:hypothetical protein